MTLIVPIRYYQGSVGYPNQEQTLRRFFDYIGYNQGFRVLTHDTTTDSTPARRSSGTRSSTSSSRGRRRATRNSR